MTDFIITGVLSGCFTVAAVIYMFQYEFNLAVLGCGLAGLGVFVMNMAGAVSWYDEGMEAQ